MFVTYLEEIGLCERRPYVGSFAERSTVFAVGTRHHIRCQFLHERPCSKQSHRVLNEPIFWFQIRYDLHCAFDKGICELEISHSDGFGAAVFGAGRTGSDNIKMAR